VGLRRAMLAGDRPARARRVPIPGLSPVGDGFLRVRGFLGRHLSVRAKLTLWYGFMCATILTLAGATMYIFVVHQLTNQIDSDLVATAPLLNRELARPLPKNLHPPQGAFKTCFNRVAAEVREIATTYCYDIQLILDRESAARSKPGQFEQVILTYGSFYSPVVIQPSHRSVVAPPSTHSLLDIAEAINGYLHFQTFSSGGNTYRVYYTRLSVPPGRITQGFAGVLEVIQNEHTYLSVEHTVFVTLLFGAPLGLVIALVIGWLIARAALRPINRISRTVQIIGESRDLSRRLQFVGPYDEVGRLATTFDGMMNRLERVFETQKRFIADASHELRTPLTTIRGNADLMRRAPPDERELCLTAIRREAERMTRLVSDLLLLAEADVAEKRIQIGVVDLDDIVLEVYNAAQLLAGEKVAIMLDHTDPITVQGDADRLKQLLLNLTDNAIKFTPPGGTVSLGVRREGDGVAIAVSDSGIGIPVEEQASIFDRFYRVEEARATRGSGLGLAICAWIVAGHGGRIEVSSAPGKGSTFTVHLPAHVPVE
jgi:two-component system OmpR family sensor kinase